MYILHCDQAHDKMMEGRVPILQLSIQFSC
jgi:hypothetical protein